MIPSLASRFSFFTAAAIPDFLKFSTAVCTSPPASSNAVRNANAPRQKMTEYKKAELQLRKTGKLKDAASAFEAILRR